MTEVMEMKFELNEINNQEICLIEVELIEEFGINLNITKYQLQQNTFLY